MGPYGRACGWCRKTPPSERRGGIMCDPLSMDHALDGQTATLNVVVAQIRARPSRSFAEARRVASDLSAWLPPDAGFVLELGVVPGTRADTGRPLDILVLSDAPLAGPV